MRRLPFICTFICIATVLFVCIPCAASDNTKTCTQSLIDFESYHWKYFEGLEISGSTIVFSADGNITLYDLGTNHLQILTQDGNNHLFAMGGSSVVWVHENPSPDGRSIRGGPADMYLYDLVTGQQRKIPGTTGPRKFRGLATDGSSVVWADSRNGNFDVFVYSIASDTEMQLSKNQSDQDNPTVEGTRVVWIDHGRYQNSDIYLYDLANQSYCLVNFQVSDKGGVILPWHLQS